MATSTSSPEKEKRRERERSYASDSSEEYISKTNQRNQVIVENFNELFIDRFTESDEKYQEYVKREAEPPPILKNYEKPRRLYYTPFSRNQSFRYVFCLSFRSLKILVNLTIFSPGFTASVVGFHD